MTTPNERIRAIHFAREFMEDLLDKRKTKRVPKEIRERALRTLRHYPGKMEVDAFIVHK